VQDDATLSLKDFLAHPARPAGTLSYHELQGFLFAVLSAPELIRPSEWMPIIFNERDAGYATLEEANEIVVGCSSARRSRRGVRGNPDDPELLFVARSRTSVSRGGCVRGDVARRLGTVGRRSLSGGSRRVSPIGRNDPCPCGSGKKDKRCCGEKSAAD
jgi:uncharacterized protein YecA (UPF0149 family)